SRRRGRWGCEPGGVRGSSCVRAFDVLFAFLPRLAELREGLIEQAPMVFLTETAANHLGRDERGQVDGLHPDLLQALLALAVDLAPEPVALRLHRGLAARL